MFKLIIMESLFNIIKGIDLKAEIEHQKQIFYSQQNEEK